METSQAVNQDGGICPTCGKPGWAADVDEEGALRAQILKLRQRLEDLDRGAAPPKGGGVPSVRVTGDEKNLEERITGCLDELSGGYGSDDE